MQQKQHLSVLSCATWALLHPQTDSAEGGWKFRGSSLNPTAGNKVCKAQRGWRMLSSVPVQAIIHIYVDGDICSWALLDTHSGALVWPFWCVQ